MLDALTPAPADKILGLMALYREDPRKNKLDLGVGVYKDETGATTIMKAVRLAEQRLHDSQVTKTYVSPAGDSAFNQAMISLVFGKTEIDKDRLFACQTAGGSGALRTIAELLNRARPGVTVHMSDPTWANHGPVMASAGLKTTTYPYFDAESGGVRFDAMIEALKKAKAGDVILLHGCCHNPTGANLTLAQWGQVADVINQNKLFAFVDLAYQGFGDGLQEDAAGLRLLASKVDELAVASSCSKNFAVYRERVGAALLMGRNGAETKIAASQILSVTRTLYSMPPDHGAACVRIVLEDPALHGEWIAELEAMRQRMLRLRVNFADALRRQSNSSRFDFIADHRGMFSRLGISPEQVDRLRDEFGIYMVGDSRFNVAGLPDDGLDDLAKAIVSVL